MLFSCFQNFFLQKLLLVSLNNCNFAASIGAYLIGINKVLYNMNQIITDSFDKITALCERHRVLSLYVFGSVLTPSFNSDSDIDFLVHFNTDAIPDYVTNYFSFKHSLESELGRPVDLVEDKSIRNPIFRHNVDRTKVPIYG
jgi:hypothetical protein